MNALTIISIILQSLLGLMLITVGVATNDFTAGQRWAIIITMGSIGLTIVALAIK